MPTREPRLLGVAGSSGSGLIATLSAARWLLILIAIAGIYFFHSFVVPVLAALVQTDGDPEIEPF